MKNEIKIEKFKLAVEQAVKQAMLAFSARIAYETSGEEFLLDLAKDFEKQISESLGIQPADFKPVANAKNISAVDAEKYYRDYFEEILSVQSVEESEEVTDKVENTSTDEKIADDKKISTAEVPQDNQITIPHEEVKKVVKQKQFDDNIVEITDINNDACIETALNDITDLENTEIVFDANVLDTDRVCGVIKTIYSFTDKLKKYTITWNKENTESMWQQMKNICSSIGVTITEKIAA